MSSQVMIYKAALTHLNIFHKILLFKLSAFAALANDMLPS